ncbi:MAG: hypothetical protein J6J97_06160 [Akkermansia sp.]|nr:hypothetical protein [Akkermansia sp.]
MKSCSWVLLLVMAMSCVAMDLPTPPACVEAMVASYGKQYEKVFAKRKGDFLEALRQRVSTLQEEQDYAAAKELADYATAVESGQELRDGASYGVEPPDFFKGYQWVDGKGGKYTFVSGQLESATGKKQRLTYAGRDFIIVEDKECWFVENAKQVGRFPLADGGKCEHLQAGAPIGKKGVDVVAEMEGKFWNGMRKATAKSRNKLKAALHNRMKKLGSSGKLDDAAAIQKYLESFGDEDTGLRAWCKAPTGTFVAPASGWVVEFGRNTSVHYGPNRTGLHNQDFVRVSPNREVYFYTGSTMLYIKGKLHKIANDTHRVLVRQKK